MNWQETINFVKQIPYGRNANREDFSLVISENKGTCSSKHAFLKDFANKNNIPNVQLIIGIYKMNEQNTNIGSLLSDNNLEYIPEAHCYLKIEKNTLDVTTNESNFEKIKADLLEEIEIEPYQVADFKINYHQNYIRNWLFETNSKISFDQVWRVRELCIEKLSS
jgi:sialic acid synthase SpsE